MLLLFRALPAAWARALGRCLGRLAWNFSSRYRKQIVRHMDIAFGDEFSQAQKKEWGRKNFEHIGLALAEFARMHLLTPENLAEIVDLSEGKVFDDFLAAQTLAAAAGGKKRGILCLPAHHGNWELGGYALALAGYPLISVARPLDNPLLYEMIAEIREKSGNRFVHKWNVLWKLKKLLDTGSIITMSVDQNGGVAGVFVPLFGTLASTVASPAELHLATGAPIVVSTVNRLADGIHHKLHVWAVIEHPKSGDHEADKFAILQKIHVAYEKAIRAYPEQWLWVHRRWKTRPPGEASDALQRKLSK